MKLQVNIKQIDIKHHHNKLKVIRSVKGFASDPKEPKITSFTYGGRGGQEFIDDSGWALVKAPCFSAFKRVKIASGRVFVNDPSTEQIE